MESKKDNVMSSKFDSYFEWKHRYYWAQSEIFMSKLQKYHSDETRKRGNIQFYFQFIHTN